MSRPLNPQAPKSFQQLPPTPGVPYRVFQSTPSAPVPVPPSPLLVRDPNDSIRDRDQNRSPPPSSNPNPSIPRRKYNAVNYNYLSLKRLEAQLYEAIPRPHPCRVQRINETPPPELLKIVRVEDRRKILRFTPPPDYTPVNTVILFRHLGEALSVYAGGEHAIRANEFLKRMTSTENLDPKLALQQILYTNTFAEAASIMIFYYPIGKLFLRFLDRPMSSRKDSVLGTLEKTGKGSMVAMPLSVRNGKLYTATEARKFYVNPPFPKEEIKPSSPEWEELKNIVNEAHDKLNSTKCSAAFFEYPTYHFSHWELPNGEKVDDQWAEIRSIPSLLRRERRLGWYERGVLL